MPSNADYINPLHQEETMSSDAIGVHNATYTNTGRDSYLTPCGLHKIDEHVEITEPDENDANKTHATKLIGMAREGTLDGCVDRDAVGSHEVMVKQNAPDLPPRCPSGSKDIPQNDIVSAV